MKMTLVAWLNLDEMLDACGGDYIAFSEEHENQGLCVECGHLQDYAEAYAVNYECEMCGKDKVCGWSTIFYLNK